MSLRAATLPPLAALSGVVHGFEQPLAPTRTETGEATRDRVGAALSGRGRLFLLRQVHGTTVRHAPWSGSPEGDAALASVPGVLVGVQTADCLPLLLVDPVRRLAAAVHAGWRGTAAGIAGEAVDALVAAGGRAERLVVGIGPGIGACCYEVGDELRAAFHPRDREFFRPGPRGRPHLDVRAANVRQLLDAGVRSGAIHHVSDCTACRGDLYPSYRRDGRGSGRMISYVGYSLPPSGV
jgi:YfiH family protein